MAKLTAYVKGDPKTNTLLDCELPAGLPPHSTPRRPPRGRGRVPLPRAPARPLSAPPPVGPFCHRVLLTLETKGVPYDMSYIDFNDKPKWCESARARAQTAGRMGARGPRPEPWGWGRAAGRGAGA
jgi:hypothetical protein